MNEFGYQVTPYFIRNQQKIRGIIERAEQIYNLTAAQNPELDKWTTYRNFFDLFRRSLAKAGKIDSGVFTKNTEQIRQYAVKEAASSRARTFCLQPMISAAEQTRSFIPTAVKSGSPHS